MKEEDKNIIYKFLKSSGIGKVKTSLDCIDGTLFLVKRRSGHWIIWINNVTFDRISKVLLNSSLKLGEYALASVIPGGHIARMAIRSSFPKAPSKNLYFSANFYEVSFDIQKVEINSDGTLGKIVDISKESLNKITDGIDSILKMTIPSLSLKKDKIPSNQPPKEKQSLTAFKIKISDILYYILTENEKNIEGNLKEWLNSMTNQFITFNKEDAENFLKEVKKSKFSFREHVEE